jgi:hypothetical protein
METHRLIAAFLLVDNAIRKDTSEIQDDSDQRTNKHILARYDGQRTVSVVSLYLRLHSWPH